MKLTKCTEQDSCELTLLMRRSKAHWGYSRKQLEEWKDELTVSEEFINAHQVYKLLINDVLVGYFAYSVDVGISAKLESLFIDPAFIGKGFGKLLMNQFLDNISQERIKKVWLESDPHASDFYLKFGFEVAGKMKTAIKNRYMPIMSKNL